VRLAGDGSFPCYSWLVSRSGFHRSPMVNPIFWLPEILPLICVPVLLSHFAFVMLAIALLLPGGFSP